MWKRLLCWWFGCEPDYDSIYFDTHQDDWPEVVPCKRCGAHEVSYAHLVGDTPHARMLERLQQLRYRLFGRRNTRTAPEDGEILPF